MDNKIHWVNMRKSEDRSAVQAPRGTILRKAQELVMLAFARKQQIIEDKEAARQLSQILSVQTPLGTASRRTQEKMSSEYAKMLQMVEDEKAARQLSQISSERGPGSSNETQEPVNLDAVF